MNLYLISQDDNQCYNQGYDVYRSAVVAAESEWDAKHTHPDGYGTVVSINPEFACSDWVSADKVKVKLIGVAEEGQFGVICNNFS